MRKKLNDSDMLSPRYTVTQEHVQLAAARPVRCAHAAVAGREVHPHDHDYFEVFLVLDGSATHVTGDYRLPATAGTVGILAPGETHALLDCRNLEVTNVYYLAEWLLEDLALLSDTDHVRALFLEPALFAPAAGRVIPHFRLDADELARVTRELADLAREMERPVPSLTYVRATFLKALLVLARAYVRAVAEPREGVRDEVWAIMESCERAIAAGTPLNLASAAGRFGVTRDHLGRLFREATGSAPSSYFRRRRVFAAAGRLLNPGARVTDVAISLGFADVAHLSRHFRAELGLSPREYRRRYLAEPTSRGR